MATKVLTRVTTLTLNPAAMLFLSAIAFAVATSCGAFGLIEATKETAEAASETATVVNNTVKEIDADGSGSISMVEIIGWMFAGWAGGRVAEQGVKVAAKQGLAETITKKSKSSKT